MKDSIKINTLRDILYSFNPNLRLESFDTPFCDFLVHDTTSSLCFAVEVKSSKNYNEAYFERFTSSLSRDVIYHGMPKCPLTLMIVDQDNNNAKIAMIIEWIFNKAMINREPYYFDLNATNRDVVMGNILKADETIRFLPSTLLNVIQKISFSYKVGEINVESFVLYFRQLSPKYKMKAVRYKSERERFERIVKGTPQDDYPYDAFDKMVFESVNNVYPNAKLKSSLLLFSTDLRNLEQEIKHYIPYKARIVVLPPNDPSLFEEFIGVTSKQFDLDVFCSPVSKSLEPITAFTGMLECNGKNEYFSILDNITKVNNVKDLLEGKGCANKCDS